MRMVTGTGLKYLSTWRFSPCSHHAAAPRRVHSIIRLLSCHHGGILAVLWMCDGHCGTAGRRRTRGLSVRALYRVLLSTSSKRDIDLWVMAVPPELQRCVLLRRRASCRRNSACSCSRISAVVLAPGYTTSCSLRGAPRRPPHCGVGASTG